MVSKDKYLYGGKLKKLIVLLTAITILVYGINFITVELFSPRKSDNYSSPMLDGTRNNGIEHLISTHLKPSFAAVHSVSGYVNMTDPDDSINIEKDRYDSKNPEDKVDFLDHETFHVIQKRIIAQESGGYPSLFNPIKTGKYLFNLYRLNEYLADNMPQINDVHEDDSNIYLRRGLETSADCYVEYQNRKNHHYWNSNGSYIGQTSKKCSNKQLNIIADMVENNEFVANRK